MTEIRVATAADEPGILAVWDEAFGEPDMAPRWRLDPNRRSWTLVAVDGADVLGAVSLVDQRRRSANGRIAPVLGLANVGVAVRARGQGLARAMTDASVAFGRRAGYDWSLLFTGTPGVYAPSGYEPFGQRRRRVGALRTNTEAAGRPARLRAGGAELLAAPGIAALHDRDADRPLTAVRDALGWRRALSWYAGCRIHVLDGPDGTPAAYAVTRVGNEPALLEAAGDRAALAALGHVIRDELVRAGAATVSIEVPTGAPYDDLVARIVADPVPVPDDTGMFHPLDADAATVRETLDHSRAFHWTGDYL
ncbi:GNAT family N-acetyltransferase [Leifsonia aquatica]|uniref:GNAT family N-acetyltransferase n=1 Tax=Leifsonia aquatica TaxID=144185 RepID=UPI0028A69E3E|nr:GNAT family N-acetyltransferase [Leifsonia aquatica]